MAKSGILTILGGPGTPDRGSRDPGSRDPGSGVPGPRVPGSGVPGPRDPGSGVPGSGGYFDKKRCPWGPFLSKVPKIVIFRAKKMTHVCTHVWGFKNTEIDEFSSNPQKVSKYAQTRSVRLVK